MDHRRTKIVATLGPATDPPGRLDELVAAGVDVFRLNFSHGTAAEHRTRAAAVRAAEQRAGRPLGLLQDLQGPKIRTATLAAPPVELRPGATIRLTRDTAPGDASRVGVTLPELIDEVAAGESLLLADGLLELRVTARESAALVCEVVHGGPLGNHKGINVPGSDLSVPALSAKDLADLAVGVELGVDWVALSFVRRVDDLQACRAELQRLGSPALLMAKIEKPSAVERGAELLAVADGLMVARGDLGVELPPAAVPVVQKRLVDACLAAGKPVVVATQMLESMIQHPRPTRAEVSDVANAIFDGADAVMLSGETAIGAYPVAAVRMMAQVAAEVEPSARYRQRLFQFEAQESPSIGAAVSHSACRLAQILPAAVVASFTWTGATARRLARHRPAARVVALTPFRKVARQLTLSWGLEPLTCPDPADSDRLTSVANEHLRAAGMVQPGDKVVLIAGVPFGRSGTTNLVRVEEIEA
ncbi:MAG: pyruvate kinase [Fimbriimonadaceae bacterium]|nr:pyruvate kinase [Fimbriimonadaceae bacterium]